MRRSLLLFILSLCWVSVAYSQIEDINKIKRNRNFLTAQSASTVSMEDASEIARTTLNLEIEQWLKERGEGNVEGFVAKSKGSVSVINTRRGSIYRAFVYVNKKDILPYYKDEDLVMDSVTTASIVASVPQPERTDTAVVQPQDSVPELTINIAPTFVITEAEQEMLEIKKFDSLELFLKKKMDSGKLSKSNVGKYATMPKHTSCHVFIYNRQGDIPACLRVSLDDVRNLRTGEEDSISNYSGCGAIWFILNK